MNAQEKIINTKREPVHTTTFTEHILLAMQMAEQYIQSGDKAEFAEQVLMREVAESGMTDKEKELCRTIASTGILKDVFGLVVDASKGKLNINKVKKRTRKCCFRWFGICKDKQEIEEKNENEGENLPESPKSIDSTEDIFFVNEDVIVTSAGGSHISTSLV